MKKLILTAFIACLAFGVQAQSFDIGIKAGANFSKLNDLKKDGLSSKTGIVAGAFATVGLGNFAIQPEVLYSQEGAKTDLGDFDLDYVNVPVLLKYYLIGNVLNVYAGPQFGFLTSHSLKNQIESKDFDFTGAVGVGVDLPLGFKIDGRYNHGFTKVTKDADGKNGVFTLALGYSFM